MSILKKNLLGKNVIITAIKFTLLLENNSFVGCCNEYIFVFSHINKLTLKFSCNGCQYSATTKGNLDIHIKGIHQKLKPYKCSECGYASSTKGNLDTHIKGVHNKIKGHQCNHCEYAATTKGNLAQHIR